MKVELIRDTHVGNYVIPKGTRLKEMGSGDMPLLVKYELPIIHALVLQRTYIELYPDCDVLLIA